MDGPAAQSEDRLPQWKGDRITGRDRTGAVVETGSRVPYTYAAVAPDVSQLVFTAETCPLNESRTIVAVGDVVGQAERVMTNRRTALHAAGADLPNVGKTTVYVASQHREDLLESWSRSLVITTR